MIRSTSSQSLVGEGGRKENDECVAVRISIGNIVVLCVYVCSMCPCVSSTGKMVGDRKKPCFSLGILPSYIGTHIKRLPSTKYAHHSTSREFIVETNMRAGTHIHIYTYTCTCTYTYIYIYTYIYTHTPVFRRGKSSANFSCNICGILYGCEAFAAPADSADCGCNLIDKFLFLPRPR